jgi:hypothetical protein
MNHSWGREVELRNNQRPVGIELVKRRNKERRE